MRFLLDNCVRRDLVQRFEPHFCAHVVDLGWAALRNGELVRRASGQFDVLVTVDKNMQFQTNLQGVPLSVVILDVNSNLKEELETAVLTLLSKLHLLRAGAFTVV